MVAFYLLHHDPLTLILMIPNPSSFSTALPPPTIHVPTPPPSNQRLHECQLGAFSSSSSSSLQPLLHPPLARHWLLAHFMQRAYSAQRSWRCFLSAENVARAWWGASRRRVMIEWAQKSGMGRGRYVSAAAVVSRDSRVYRRCEGVGGVRRKDTGGCWWDVSGKEEEEEEEEEVVRLDAFRLNRLIVPDSAALV